MADEQVTRRYAYYSEHDSPRHKGKCSAYLVEQMSGSNVVARITPLGFIKDLTAEQEIELLLLKQGISLVGKWSPTKRGHNRKSRVVIGNGFAEVK